MAERRPGLDPGPWLTVVTVVRNDREALAQTLSSVAEQPRGEAVHLILDGASTDGSAELALAAARPGLVQVRSEPDGGIYEAMNDGIALARTPMVLFLNAGDRFAEPDILAGLTRDWRADPVDWIRRPIIWTAGGGRPSRATPGAELDPRRFRAGRQPVLHQGTIMSRDLLQTLGGFRTRFRIAADFDLMCRALDRGARPSVGEQPLALVDDSGISTRLWRQSLREVSQIRGESASTGARVTIRAQTGLRFLEVGARRAVRTRQQSWAARRTAR